MSIEDLTAFACFLKESKYSGDETAREIEEELWNITTKEEFILRSIELGQQNGYEFTRQEMEAWYNDRNEEKLQETRGESGLTHPIKDMEPSYQIIFF